MVNIKTKKDFRLKAEEAHQKALGAKDDTVRAFWLKIEKGYQSLAANETDS